MNLPNKITVARIVMVFIFLALANVEKLNIFQEQQVYIIHFTAYIIAIIAGLSDILDGYLARKLNMVTDFGKLMDPLADKIYIVVMFITAVEIEVIPMPAWIVIIIISREFLVTGLRMLAASKGEVIAADKFGKLKTLTQMIILVICGLLWLGVFEYKTLPVFLKYLWHGSLWITAIITVSSGIGYFIKGRHLYKDSK